MKTFTKVILVLFLVLFNYVLNAQWVSVSNPPASICFIASGADYYGASGSNKLYHSSNGGVNWDTVYRFTNGNIIRSLAVKSNLMFAGLGWGSDQGIFMSSNNGVNWTKQITVSEPYCLLAANATDVYAGTAGGVYLSTNNGTSWVQTALTVTTTCLATDGTYIYAGYGDVFGTGTKALRRTMDRGATWNNLGLQDSIITCIAVIGNTIICGGTGGNPDNSGLYRSTNMGANWSTIPLQYPQENMEFLMVIDNNIIGKSNLGSIYLSKNTGSSWINKTDNLPHSNYDSPDMLYASGYLFTKGSTGQLYKRQYTEIIGVQKISSEIPDKFSLYQNYPNPFNPSTTIRYQIPKEQIVMLKIFDIMGKEIETIVNEKQSPGAYEVNWNALKFSSGVYFYKIETEGFTDTKRMLLVK